jgi:creatinine amidohydrolase
MIVRALLVAGSLSFAMASPSMAQDSVYIEELTWTEIRDAIKAGKRFPGAITLPEEHYQKLLEYTARSLRVNGFTDVVMIGDSGGNQKGMGAVAALLNREWAGTGVRVHFIPEYYNSGRFSEYLLKQGYDQRANMGGFEGSGVTGDPTKASPELGRLGIQFKVDVVLEALQKSMAAR